MPFFTYMIKFDNGYLYTGSTGKIRIRAQRHWRKGDHPVVIWKQVFTTRDEALLRERQIKGWTRAKKLALATGDIATLKNLSKRRGGTPPKPPTRNLTLA